MSYIKIKKEDNLLPIPDESVETIANATDKYIKTKEDTLMKVGNQFIRASDVLRIIKEVPKKETKGEEVDGYYEERKRNLRRSVEDRAGETFWFDFIYWGVHKKEPTEEERGKAKEINLKFFEKNPLRQFVNPGEYGLVVGEDAKLGKYLCSFIERILDTDNYYSKYKV